jgi:coproporphyrinogen III oxidase-like Fe-S oxidoreductase
MTDEPFDRRYWGDKIDISRWSYECARGINYHQTAGQIMPSGPGAIRKISTGRKARGSASDGYDRQQAHQDRPRLTPTPP